MKIPKTVFITGNPNTSKVDIVFHFRKDCYRAMKLTQVIEIPIEEGRLTYKPCTFCTGMERSRWMAKRLIRQTPPKPERRKNGQKR